MIDPRIFDPRSPRCRSPYGALPAGKALTLTLYPPRRMACLGAWVTLRWEQRGELEETIPIPWQDCELGVDRYSVSIPIPRDYQGLVWYTVRAAFPREVQESGVCQLTVYDGSETVPEWFGQGLCYQIFPDRFCRLDLPANMGPGDRILHENWSDEPIYKPEPNGEVTNRDFFGGSLPGIISKLDYLAGLGVETIYLCPIFEALENHRYGTADYEKIDPILGTEADFKRLCREAHRRGIRIILDGVFNHVGWASKYFNATGVYGEGGAARDPHSPYRDWFLFEEWPHRYKSWWGFKTLPDFNKSNPRFLDYICGENGIIRAWLRRGADGWRLDVADELPDEMVALIHAAARAEKPDAPIIGEVWEDGSTKMAYGVRRKHILGGHCDGLMNYPFRDALLSYLLGGDARDFMRAMETIRENYPPFAFHNAMNALGTHDTLRTLTLLGVGEAHREDWTKDARAEYVMTPREHARGLERLRLGFAILIAFPGAPTIYYGDEAGLTGFEDPFNRGTYPWGREDKTLISYVSKLGSLRKTHPALREGDIEYLAADGGLLAFSRQKGGDRLILASNRDHDPRPLELPWPAVDLLTGETFPREAVLPPARALVLEKR